MKQYVLVNCFYFFMIPLFSDKPLKVYKQLESNKFGRNTFYESTSFTNVIYDHNYLGRKYDKLEDLS